MATPHGPVRVDWSAGPPFALEVELPDGVEGVAILPDGSERAIGAGSNAL